MAVQAHAKSCKDGHAGNEDSLFLPLHVRNTCVIAHVKTPLALFPHCLCIAITGAHWGEGWASAPPSNRSAQAPHSGRLARELVGPNEWGASAQRAQRAKRMSGSRARLQTPLTPPAQDRSDTTEDPTQVDRGQRPSRFGGYEARRAHSCPLRSAG
jgi:hypothetical protein